MVTTPLENGDVLPLVREVTGSPDPLALYRSLSDGGRRPGTFLLESAETGAGAGDSPPRRGCIGSGAIAGHRRNCWRIALMSDV